MKEHINNENIISAHILRSEEAFETFRFDLIIGDNSNAFGFNLKELGT